MNNHYAFIRRFILLSVLSMGFAYSLGCSMLKPGYRSVPRRVIIPAGDTKLPVEWWCDYAMVQVVIDDQGLFNFLLDTGASESIVTPEVASLFPKQTFRVQRSVRGSSGRRVAVRQAFTTHTLKAGDLRIHSFDALVMDLTVVSDAIGKVIDGVLGCPVFHGSLLRVDYLNREVRVLEGTLAGTKRDDQFRVTGEQRPYIAFTLDGETYPVLVDTGSSGGLSLKQKVFHKQHYFEEPVVVSSTVGVSGRIYNKLAARIKGSATIGPHVIHEPIVDMGGKSSLLGVNVLRHFILTYDRKNALTRIERPEDTPIEMKSIRSTGVGYRRRIDGWSIWHIYPYADQAAQALQIDDVVTRVAGISVADIDCDLLRQINSTSETVEIEIERDDRRLTVTLPVVDIIP